MEKINLNKICERKNQEKIIVDFLCNFEYSVNTKSKKGVYIYGDSGIGKTNFVLDILKNNNYDAIYYNSSDIRNKGIIETITKYNMSDKSILTLLNKKIKRPVIVMDEIDGMIVGDKGGINSLIKLIRPKKTKKQKNEDNSLNPIICIGNYQTDKKIKELIKICINIELKKINPYQMNIIIDNIIPNINSKIKNNIICYLDGNLRKMKNIYRMYKDDNSIFDNEKIFTDILFSTPYNYNINSIVHKLITEKYEFSQHLKLINETDRTTVGLNFHENIVNFLDNDEKSMSFYIKFLENMCFSDYIDRITFQKQIWQFNEMSSLIKNFKNNKIYHEYFSEKNNKIKNTTNNDIRFTKVLTKYSSEYNNLLFIQYLCQQLMIDKKDLFTLFSFLKIKYNSDINEIYKMFENYEINKLDVNRIYKYIEKTMKDDNFISHNDDDDEHNFLENKEIDL